MEIIMKNNRKKRISCIISLLFSAVLIFIDQITKFLAVSHLKGQDSIILIDGVFQFTYLENRGAAFGLLSGKKSLFVILTIVFLVFLVFAYTRIPETRRFFLMKFIVVLFFSGAIGNFIDRIAQNYVIDFFYFSLINFPIFNVADIYVTVAAALFIISFLFYYKEADFEQIFPTKKVKE